MSPISPKHSRWKTFLHRMSQNLILKQSHCSLLSPAPPSSHNMVAFFSWPCFWSQVSWSSYFWADILNVGLNINMLHMHWFNCTTHSHVPSCGHGRDQAELDVVVDQELSDCWWPLIRSLLTSSISTYGKPHVWISVGSFVLTKHRSLHSWPTAMFLFTYKTVSFYSNICWELPFGGNTQLL